MTPAQIDRLHQLSNKGKGVTKLFASKAGKPDNPDGSTGASA